MGTMQDGKEHFRDNRVEQVPARHVRSVQHMSTPFLTSRLHPTDVAQVRSPQQFQCVRSMSHELRWV